MNELETAGSTGNACSTSAGSIVVVVDDGAAETSGAADMSGAADTSGPWVVSDAPVEVDDSLSDVAGGSVVSMGAGCGDRVIQSGSRASSSSPQLATVATSTTVATSRVTRQARDGIDRGITAVYGGEPIGEPRDTAPTMGAVSNPRIVRRNPPGLHRTGGYHHVTIVESGPIAHLAGQCPLDDNEEVVGLGDYEAQVDQVAANSLVALADAGATPDDVVRSVVYVMSSDSTVLARVWHRFAEDTALAPAFLTASTLVGVTALGYQGQLVELDLTAALTR